MLRERLKGNLDLLLLTVLATGPAHGYEIAERLRTHSAGAFDLPEGTVYPALHRLEAHGWIASAWRVEAGRRRRVYELTSRGRRQLAVQRREWSAFIAGMAAVLGGSPA
ncbi:MAG: PadR family transcriptional regulator [Microlunatus sp.]|nr:PadR family transcriptional regulator [Microlunatus sp.]